MRKIVNFLLSWNELLSIPIALLLWWASPVLIRWLDPTAATYDGGIFQQIIFAVIAVLVFHGMAWLLLKITFPHVYQYMDTLLEQNLKNFNSPSGAAKPMTLWEKSKLVLFLFALYFLAFLLAFKTL